MHFRTGSTHAFDFETRTSPHAKPVSQDLSIFLTCPVLQFASDVATKVGAGCITIAIHPDKLAACDYLKPEAAIEPSPLAAVGRYLPDPVVFSAFLHIPHSANCDTELTEARVVDAAHATHTAFRFSDRGFDTGKRDGLAETVLACQQSAQGKGKAKASGIGAAKLKIHIRDPSPISRRLDGRATAFEGATL